MKARMFWLAGAASLALGLAPAHGEEAWRILPAESSLAFKGYDPQGGPYGGAFGKMTGAIAGDPDHLEQSHIKIDVDLSSLSGDMSDTEQTLRTEDWFDTAKFPHAVYESRSITRRADGRYEAAGELSLHGIKAPVTLVFTLPVYGPKPGAPGVLRAVAKGSARLSRTAFKVGGPEWGQVVADAVDVVFTLTAERAAQN